MLVCCAANTVVIDDNTDKLDVHRRNSRKQGSVAFASVKKPHATSIVLILECCTDRKSQWKMIQVLNVFSLYIFNQNVFIKTFQYTRETENILRII